MKLLINAGVLQSEGGVVILLGILEHLPAVQPEASVVLYLNPDLEERFRPLLADRPNVELVPFHPGTGIRRLCWEQVTLPDILKRDGVDLLFSFANTGPMFPGCEQVLYVQQAIPYADYIPPKHRWRWKRIQWSFRLAMGLAQLGAQRIVVPTRWLIEPMRQSVFNHVPESAYVVSLPGIPPAPIREGGHHVSYSEKKRQEELLIEELRNDRAVGRKILFYPCFLAPYKNLSYLIEALSTLERSYKLPFRAVLTVDRESPEHFSCRKEVFETFRRLNPQNTLLAGSLSRETIEQVYGLSDALIFPSLVETLGLPLLEAMRHRLPILAVRTLFAQEVCGEAALYADPASSEDFARKMAQLLTDTPLREALKVQGQNQITRYDWASHLQAVFGQAQ